MRTLVGILLVLLAASLVWAMSSHRHLATERAGRQQDSVDAETHRLDVLQASRRVWEEEQAKQKQHHDSTLAEYRSIITGLRRDNRHAARELAERLAADTSVSEPVFADVARVVSNLTREAEVCTNALASCDSALAVRDKLLRAADSTITETQNLLHAQRALTATYRDAAHPSWVEKMRQNAPWVIGALVLGLVVGLSQ